MMINGDISKIVKNIMVKSKLLFEKRFQSLFSKKEAQGIINDNVIDVDELNGTIKIMHITDAHISIIRSDEEEFHRYSKRMDNAFKQVKHYETKLKSAPSDIFQDLLMLAKNKSIDLIVLSGDIVNNPSQSSVTYVYESLKKVQIPYIFIAGNHDWHYEGMKGTAEQLRQTWTNKHLLPLYNGQNPFYASFILEGINFVAIDNSTYQVQEEQLIFLKDQLQREYKVVLILHIPLYLKEVDNKNKIEICGSPRWGYKTDKNFRLEKRERWPEAGNLKTTMAFIDVVRENKNILAVLAGHTHKDRVNQVSESAKQYVTGGALNGQYRILKFEPNTRRIKRT